MVGMDSGMLRTAAAVAVAGAGLVLVAWPVGAWAVVARLEKPRYTLVRRLAGAPWWAAGAWREAIELREYSPYLVAEVEVPAKQAGDSQDLRSGLGAGFRAIAGEDPRSAARADRRNCAPRSPRCVKSKTSSWIGHRRNRLR